MVSSDDEPSSQEHFVPQSNDQELLWTVLAITDEQNGMYKIKWAGINPETGRPWPQDWVPRADCTDDLVAEWKRKKAAKRRKKSGAGKASGASKSKSRSVRASRSTSASASANAPRRQSLRSGATHSPEPNARASSSSTRLDHDQVLPKTTKRRRTSTITPLNDTGPPNKKQRVATIELFSEQDTEEADINVGEGPLPSPSRPKPKLPLLVSDDDTEEDIPSVKGKARTQEVLKFGPPRKSLGRNSNKLGERPDKPLDAPPTNGRSKPLSTSPHRRPLLTQSQIVSLREEEEEESQVLSYPDPPEHSLQPPAEDPEMEKDSFRAEPALPSRPPSSTPIMAEEEEEESQPIDLNQITHRDEEVHSLSDSDDLPQQQEPTAQRSTASLVAVDDGSPTHDRRSFRAHKTPIFNKTQKPLRPIPQISPSVFASLPRTQDDGPPSSIEQFSSPVKPPAPESSLREWGESSSNRAADSSKGRGRLPASRGQGSSNLQAKGKRPANPGLRAKMDWTEFARKPAALTFFPFSKALGKVKDKAESKEANAKLDNALRALLSNTQSQNAPMMPEVESPEMEPSIQASFPQESDDVVREMEDKYVDLSGGVEDQEEAGVEDEIDVERSLYDDAPPANKNIPQEEVLPGTASSKVVSDESQSQSQGDSAHIEPTQARLDAALSVLHQKSEELTRVEHETADLRERYAEAVALAQSEQAKRHILEAQLQQEREARSSIAVQTDVVPAPVSDSDKRLPEVEALLASERASWATERAAWSTERSSVQSEVSTLQASHAAAQRDVDFFREQYRSASTYASTVRTENDELVERTKIAESQASTGVKIVRATYESRVKKLEDELRRFKALVELLKEKDRRTNDEVRWRAAMEPELRKENQRLRAALEEREAEVDELNDELLASEKQNKRLERKIERVEGKNKLLVAASDPKGKGKAVAAMVVNDDSDDDDDDYAPSRHNTSSSDEESSSEHSSVHSTREVSPVLAEDIDPEEPARRHSDAANTRISERVSPPGQSEKHDMAFLCRWQQDGAQSCQVVVNDRQELYDHVFSQHVVSN